eukprot:jgi/Ulvmu1/9341/UM050_0092.1
MVHTSVAVRVRTDPGRSTKCPAPFRGLPIQVEVDHIFEQTSTQDHVFSSSIANAVDGILQGQDACVLVYGAPVSGKTHTLVGQGHLTSFAAGIVPQAVEAILSQLRIVPKDKFQLQATLSGLTARQDACLMDLLDPDAPATALRETGATGAAAKLSVMSLDCMDDAYTYLRHRSLQQQPPSRPGSALAGSSPRQRPLQDLGPMHVMYSLELITRPGQADEHVAILTFVELIGPESKDAYGMRTHKPDEALQRQLARSYTALASVLLALRSDVTSAAASALHAQPGDPPHVPWRDSPLTKWLRPVLTAANALTILATVDPSPDAAQETLATLTYVSRFRTPRPGVRISAPLPGQVEWEVPSRPGSTQPGGRRNTHAGAARQPRSASATPRASTPPSHAGNGPSTHVGPCHAAQSHWQPPDLTPRSQPLLRASGQRGTQLGDWSLQDRARAADHGSDRRLCVADAAPRAPVSTPAMQWAAATQAHAGRGLRLAEPRSPGTEGSESPQRLQPPAGLARANAHPAASCDDGQEGRRAEWGPGGNASAPDGRVLELLATLRQRGVGVREEALLEQLSQDFSKARDEAAEAGAFRQRAEQRIRSLEAALEEQAKDRAAAVVVIEQLQKELREAQCECMVLSDQRRYFEERAAAAGAPQGETGFGGAVGGFRGEPDAGPGLVPVQELIEARAQAADARAEAFAARQEVQTAQEHAAELLRQLQDRIRSLVCTNGGEVDSDGVGGLVSPVVAASGGSSGNAAPAGAKACVAALQDALGAVQALAGVQQHMQRLARGREEAVRRVEAVEAAGGAKAVAAAETAANSAAAEAALERAKSRDLASRAAQLQEERDASASQANLAAEEAVRYRSTAAESRKKAKQLEGRLAAVQAELQAAQQHEPRARQADAAEAELRLERARHTELEVRAADTQAGLTAAREQAAELHSLNEALTRELEGVRAELAISERAQADTAEQRAAVEQQLLGVQERALGLERDIAALLEADRHRSAELQQGSEAAAAMRAERDIVQERLAEAQGHLSRAVADADRFRAQASSRDGLLNHMWTFVTSMDQLLQAAKDVAAGPAASAAGSPGKAGAKAAADAALPGSWDDPVNQEKLLSATAAVRAAAAPMMKELQEVVQLRAEAEELQHAQRTTAESEQSLQAHVGTLEAQLHDCQQQLEELKPRLAASTRKYKEARQVAHETEEQLLELQQQHSAAAEDLETARSAAGVAQGLSAQLQAAQAELEVREGEIAQLVAELQEAGARTGDAEAAAREAGAQAQQMAMNAAAAQEAVERMQHANQELVQRYDHRAAAANAEESRLLAEVEEHRAALAQAQARAQELDRRASGSAAAAQECTRLRQELDTVTEERRAALERQRVAEGDARDARHEAERLQEEVRRLEGERRSAVADSQRLQKERAAAAETRRTLDASFERLDRARERTRAALSTSRTSRTGLALAGPADSAASSAPGVAPSIGARSAWSRIGAVGVLDTQGGHRAAVGSPDRPKSSAGALTVPAGRSRGAGVATLQERGAGDKGPFASAVPSWGGAGSQIAFADRMKPAVEARLAALDPLAKPARL